MFSILAKPLAVLIAFSGILMLSPTPAPSPLPQNLTASDQIMADGLAEKISTTEWLGPMAPVALSPFFGITCLAGMSQFGKGTVLEQNNFISTNPVLNNPTIFWVFLVLTLLTSLPRLTKVSKPMAQALDQVETYSGIITLLVIKVLGSSLGGDGGDALETAAVVQLGFLSFTSDMLLSIAAVINIIVINTIKFFFEVLILITPVPFLDAAFEAGKQATCAGLLAIYAFSPFVATIINLLIFIACLWAYRWIHRRVAYARAVLFDPLLALWNPKYGQPTKEELVVFNQDAFGPFPAKTKLKLTRSESGWQLNQLLMFSIGLPKKMEIQSSDTTIVMKRGVFVNQLNVDGGARGKLLFSRRYSDNLDQLADMIQVGKPNGQDEAVQFDLKTA